MKRTILYIVSAIAVAAPWLFLLEVLPVPYNRISTALEITIESVMFAALLAVVILLKKEIRQFRAAGKRNKAAGGNAGDGPGGQESGRPGGEKSDGPGGQESGRPGGQESGRAGRIIGRILFVFASVTLFVVGLILVLITISFTLL